MKNAASANSLDFLPVGLDGEKRLPFVSSTFMVIPFAMIVSIILSFDIHFFSRFVGVFAVFVIFRLVLFG